ncbi:MAG: hypothetical protein Q8Q52_03655 [Acidimicrobiia bacterium]|nr:hypothetical protein [Acidimicrobiia bacterium]
MGRINDLAHSLKGADESRSLDQLRADVFLDLLDGHTHQGPTGSGVVNLQVDLDTLAGLAENPGELAGYGPVIADIARQVTENQQGADWRWTLPHPDGGLPLHHGSTRRRPLRGQRRESGGCGPLKANPDFS